VMVVEMMVMEVMMVEVEVEKNCGSGGDGD
jgi:hypothetical protein